MREAAAVGLFQKAAPSGSQLLRQEDMSREFKKKFPASAVKVVGIHTISNHIKSRLK
jgi:hypothetical protein